MTDKELLAAKFVGWWCDREVLKRLGLFSIKEIGLVLGQEAIGEKGWYDIMCRLIEEWHRHRTLSVVEDPELRELIAAKRLEWEMGRI